MEKRSNGKIHGNLYVPPPSVLVTTPIIVAASVQAPPPVEVPPILIPDVPPSVEVPPVLIPDAGLPKQVQTYVPPTGVVPVTNTHHYDGALPQDSDLGRLLVSTHDKGTLETRREVVSRFISEASTFELPEKNPISVGCLTTTVVSWDTAANKDNTNHITADDLLYVCAEIWNSIKTHEPELLMNFAREFFSQFMDMQTGLCPQGRTVRLWQIAYSYLSWHPDFYVQNNEK